MAARDVAGDLAPFIDLVIVVTAGHVDTGHEKQNLAQGKTNAGRLAMAAYLARLLEKKRRAVLDRGFLRLNDVHLPRSPLISTSMNQTLEPNASPER